MTHLAQGPLKSVRYAPAEFKSATDRRRFKSGLLGPRLDSPRLSAVRQEMVPSAIVVLSLARCPRAIRRLVVTVVVAALYRQSGWPLAHIGEETVKSQPRRADADPSSAVATEIWVLRIEATLQHVGPSGVGRRQPSDRVAVFERAVTVNQKATTRPRRANFSGQGTCVDGTPIAADAHTKPLALPRRRWFSGLDHGKPSKYCSCDVHQSNPVVDAIPCSAGRRQSQQSS